MRSLAASLVFAAAAIHASAVQPLPSLGEPALSPDRSEIAFVSGGDIWTVAAKGGAARLLVSHPATESRPLYSPDGTRLAFTSTRTGNGDIYVLTFSTGELTRITYSDSLDLLDGWSPDGKWLYFTSTANDIANTSDIFRVSSAGGTPLEVLRDRYYSEFRGAPSPDGTHIAFVTRGISSNQWWRHGHSHLDESEIWIKGIADNTPYQRVVEEDAKQGWPMWSADGQSIFYMSDRSGTENIYRQRIGAPNSEAKAVTNFKDGRLLWPSVSYDGREIVFERNFSIWKLDTQSASAAQVPITLRGSVSSPQVDHIQTTQFNDLALSPDGKKVALISHGEVFAASSAPESGRATRITRTPAPETSIEWSPDSKRLLYLSARNGHTQIFEYDLTGSKEQQLTDPATQDDDSPRFSPDGKRVAYVRGERELHVLTLDGKKDISIASGFLPSPAITWAPDGKFIAYTTVGAKSFRNLSIVASDGGSPSQPASFLANGETASLMSWSQDGRYLLFDTSQRSEQSQIARLDLVPHLPKFREDQFRELFRNREPNPERSPAPNPDKPADTNDGSTPASASAHPNPAEPPKKTEPTRVVFAGIRDRLSFIPLGFDAADPVISPDGKTLIFIASTGNQRNLYSYSLDELATTPPSSHQLTSTATPKTRCFFSPDSKQIYYLDGGRLTSLNLETHTSKTSDVSAEFDVDFDSDKSAAFEQGWSLLNKRFFDPEFHGQNWKALHDTFAPYVAGAQTPDEMRRDINLMIGELNSSHSGINPPPRAPNAPPPPSTPFSPAGEPVGRIGLRFEREPYEAGRGLIIREIIPLGPAALEGSIKVGESLLALDGDAIGAATNLDSLLTNKVDRRVVLTIGAANNPANKREAIVRPVSLTTEKGLLYRAWADANRAYVDRISGGKLGYVHIADMSSQSLNQLYIDLDVQNQTKEGVIIDIRDNNGGFVNEYAIDVFSRRNYLTMTPRGGSPAPARPFLGQRALGLPTVLVTNQDSLSDAEDFTEGYRDLKLGKVVGEPTAGWIIYTFNAPLIDGSVIRVPTIRVQAADGQTMEMHPRPVDVFVERMAGESLLGKDTQLDRAAKELLGQIARR